MSLARSLFAYVAAKVQLITTTATTSDRRRLLTLSAPLGPRPALTPPVVAVVVLVVVVLAYQCALDICIMAIITPTSHHLLMLIGQ